MFGSNFCHRSTCLFLCLHYVVFISITQNYSWKCGMKIPPAWNILLRRALAVRRSSVVSDEFLHFFLSVKSARVINLVMTLFKIYLVSFEHPKTGCFFQCLRGFIFIFRLIFMCIYVCLWVDVYSCLQVHDPMLVNRIQMMELDILYHTIPVPSR